MTTTSANTSADLQTSTGPSHYVLILTAVRMESNAIAESLNLHKTLDGGHRGTFAGREIVLRTIGVGAVAMHAIDPTLATTVVLAGLAGGLDPLLRAGEIVIDGAVPERFRPHWPLHQGRIVCIDHILATPRDKAELFKSTGALAVEMESQAVREAAELAKVPMVHVRAILDTAKDSLDANLSKLVDRYGQPRYDEIARHLFPQFWRIAPLLKLGKASKQSCRAMAFAVKELISHLPAVSR